MAVLKGLGRLKNLRRVVVDLKRIYLNKVWGMNLDRTCDFSLSARFDTTHPRGVHVGPETYVAFDAAILAHDTTRRYYADTRIGARCFIGARSIVLPGISVGDGSIVAAGAVVTKDVPPHSIGAGNPATVVRSDIEVDAYGRLHGVKKVQSGA